MIWKITAYNGTQWTSNYNTSLLFAIREFIQETGLHEMDIKLIENLH